MNDGEGMGGHNTLKNDEHPQKENFDAVHSDCYHGFGMRSHIKLLKVPQIDISKHRMNNKGD